ncbi:TPA: DUF86 domain-containing protein [bacterium]|nr:DUF86 domain-containing protein [bacterium]
MAIEEKKLADIFKDYDEIVAVYLFGSQVKGNADKFSDYDFAVLLDDKPYKDGKLQLMGELITDAFSVVGQDKADVVDLSEAPIWFQQVVIKSGKVILEKSKEKRLHYENELKQECLKEGVPEYVEDGKMRKIDIQVHIDTIEENLKNLSYIAEKYSLEELKENKIYLDGAVREIQTSIESLIDISRYIMRHLRLSQAEEYWQIPVILADAGYIEERDVNIYSEMIRFRNLVVHYYYKVNPEDVYRIITQELYDIRKWLETLLKIVEGS